MIPSTELVSNQGIYIAFTDNPMIISVTYESADFTSGNTAYEAILIVAIGDAEYRYSSEMALGSTSVFDIRSAFVEEYAKTQVLPSTTQQPILRAKVYLQKSYLRHNELFKSYDSQNLIYEEIYGLRGGYSMSEIIRNGWSHPSAATLNIIGTQLTKRPSGRPVRGIGDTLFQTLITMTPTGTWETGGKFQYSTTKEVLGSNATSGSQYIVDTNPNRIEFMFINSFGVIESVSCLSYDKYNVAIESQSYNIVGTQGYHPDGYTKNVANYRDTFSMSSGFLSAEWLEWFAKEFLVSPRHWMRIRGTSTLLPVSIKIKDKAEIYDRAKAELNEIIFEVTV